MTDVNSVVQDAFPFRNTGFFNKIRIDCIRSFPMLGLLSLSLE